jgi:hypothetical protein
MSDNNGTVLKDAADMQRARGGRTGIQHLDQLLELENVEKLVVIGDMHVEPGALYRLKVKYGSDLERHKTTMILIGDIVSTIADEDYNSIVQRHGQSRYGDYNAYKQDAGKRAYNLLLQTAKLKCAYPANFHVLPGNGELDFMRKRAGDDFKNWVLGLGSDQLLRNVKEFIETMPLFATVTVDGKRYLFSHGGVVRSTELAQQLLPLADFAQNALKPLVVFPRYGIDYVGRRKASDLEIFNQICYPSAQDEPDPTKCVQGVCQVFEIHYQVCGHIHLFGPKQQEIKKLCVRIPQSSVSYGKTDNGLVHIVNSMGLNGEYTHLEITADGIEPKII